MSNYIKESVNTAYDSIREGTVKTDGRKKSHGLRYGRVAAAAAVVIVAGSTAYAAANNWGLMDFFQSRWNVTVPKEAAKMVETDVEQEKLGGQVSDYVKGSVKEALCDKNSTHVEVEVTPVDQEKYLLIPAFVTEDDPVSSLNADGLDKKVQKLSIGEYARKLKKEIIFVSVDIDQNQQMDSCSIEEKLSADGTLLFNISGDNPDKTESAEWICGITLRSETILEAGNDRIRDEFAFTVHDQSTMDSVVFVPKAEEQLADTGMIVDEVKLEKTELGIYCHIDYHFLEDSSIDTTEIKDGVVFELTNKNGKVWKNGLSDKGQTYEDGDGKFVCERNYGVGKIPEKLYLKVFNCWTKEVYGTMEITR